MYRVLVGGLHHESNTFNPIITSQKDFSVRRGEELSETLNRDDSMSGIIDTLRDAGCEVLPTLSARAVPNGEVDPEVYAWLKGELLQRAGAAGDVDALALALHGSMRVAGLGDAEGDILEELRRMFPDVPVFVALDMHATVTRRMLANADGFVGYKQAPHTDCYETGVHAARMTLDTLSGRRTPVTATCTLPMLIAGEKSETSVEPMRSMIEHLRAIEHRPGVMAASLLLGFPWADTEDNRVCALVVADGSEESARESAEEIADAFWQQRRQFRFHTESYSAAEALDRAVEAAESGPGPVYLSESGDNPTAGAAGDSTLFLEELLRHGGAARLQTPVLYGGIYDPEAVTACLEAADGVVELRVGSGFDPDTSTPLSVRGSVLATARSWGDYAADMALVRTGNVDIVVASAHLGYVTPDLFRALGADPAQRALVVVKLGYLTAEHKAVAARSIMALTPGNSYELLEEIPYRKVKRPLFPLDDDAAKAPCT